jgi:AcrR family transcriptional regulator
VAEQAEHGAQIKPPIWARDEPRSRGPRAPLSRAQIVQTAVRIADGEGLETVSIRRIARELTSGAMSLYHYFDSRDELLDLMSDTVAGEMLVPGPLPEDWREALTAIAQHTRRTFLAHPWMLLTLQDRPRVSPNLLRHVEQSAQSVASLGASGVAPELVTGIVTATDDYTIGFTLRELAAGGSDDERGRRIASRFAEAYDDPHVRSLLESGEFPILSAFIDGGATPRMRRFEAGLEWMLDGFEARLRR